jgi:hypothetical protein
MQEAAIAWSAFAWLLCWDIDLAFVLARGPVLPDPLLKFVVVTAAVIVLGFAMSRRHWFWGA